MMSNSVRTKPQACDAASVPAGHMLRAGLLSRPDVLYCLELGAGKAWLSGWLGLALRVHHLLLLDSQAGFQKKVRSYWPSFLA